METRPPEIVSLIVRLLVPPASREHVLGDLNERYESPGRYVIDALKTVPFVVASRVRRTVNPGLSAFLALYLWFGVFWGPAQKHWFIAAVPALISVAVLVLRDAYRTLAPHPYRAAAGDVIAAAAAVLTTQAMCAFFAPDWTLTSGALRVGFPLGFFLLFFVRLQSPTGVHQPIAFAPAMTMQELSSEIDVYERIVRRAIRIELGAAVVVIACFAAALIFAPPTASMFSTLGLVLALSGAVFVGVFLFRNARLRPIIRSGFAATVALYRQELERRLRLSRTYLWWYVLPLSIGPAVLLIGPQLVRPAAFTRIAVTVVLLIVFACALVFAQKPVIRKIRQRIQQLSVVVEKT
jgi:hypothetical protein